MDLPLLGITAATLSGIAFALYQIMIKRLQREMPAEQAERAGTFDAFAIPRLLGFLLPFWLALGLAAWQTEWLSFNITAEALRWPLAWAVCTVLSTTVLVWLLGRFSLAEVAGYKKALITLGAVLVDIWLFGLGFPLLTLAAIALLLSGALGLSKARNRLPTRLEWGVIGVWCTVLVVQISLYKYGLQQQPQVLAHTVIAQTFAASLYALLWLVPHIKNLKLPPLRLIVPLWLAVLAGTMLEGFAYAGLPLALVLVVTMLPAALMAGHDLWRGDLPTSGRTWVALAALAAGFFVLVLT